MADSYRTRARRSRSRTSTPVSSNRTPLFSDQLASPSVRHTRRTPAEGSRSPLTPCVDASFRNDDKVSPMLAKLRTTPGRLLKEKQSLLVLKHELSRRRVDSLNVGGGVSIWPEMEAMRLTRNDVYRLAISCTLLAILVIAAFLLLHGATMLQLLMFHEKLVQFPRKHVIIVDQGQMELDSSLVQWHTDYLELVDSIKFCFDVSNVPTSYVVYMLLYAATLCTLLYYLVDNMFAKSKLSPRRIKRWSGLLTLTFTWTILIAMTFVTALRTEVAIETNIHILTTKLGQAIPSNLSCAKFQQVLLYWQTRCLPPATHGTIAIFGVVSVRDLSFYLQYYSIPIATVLLMPVFRVLVAVMTLYNVNNKIEKVS